MTEERKEPDWKFIEKIATFLEQSITPSATVQHDVKLPVLGKPNRRPRQCDIVITYGKPPRQTTTIVEVQKRSRKPTITVFHGWIKKMREVGAQNLICVSTKGFPGSIIDSVNSEYGPTVRLLTLEELNKPEILGLSFIAPHLLYRQPHIELESVGDVYLQSSELNEDISKFLNEFALNQTEKLFELETHGQLALTDLINAIFDQISDEWIKITTSKSIDYRFTVDLGTKFNNLWIQVRGERYRVINFPVTGVVTNNVSEIPLLCYEYKQEFHFDILAWIVSAKGVINNREIFVQQVYQLNQEGILQLTAINHKGIDNINLYLSTDKTALTSYLANHGLLQVNSMI